MLAVLALCAGARAQDAPVQAAGRINAVDADARVVNVTHEPIPAIGWPAMTMDLGVADAVDLSAVAPGTVVDFTLEKGPDGMFRIGTMRAAAAEQQAVAPADDGLSHRHDMTLDFGGMVMNQNAELLPENCAAMGPDVAFTVHVGTRYARGRPGAIYGYSQSVFEAAPCARITVTLVNEDSVRHQWMVHGLPRYLYPQGMFHLEAAGGATKTGTFIVPADAHTYLVHCDMAQHMEKGLKGELVVAGGSGDLPSVPGVSGPLFGDAARAVAGSPEAVALSALVAALALAAGLWGLGRVL